MTFRFRFLGHHWKPRSVPQRRPKPSVVPGAAPEQEWPVILTPHQSVLPPRSRSLLPPATAAFRASIPVGCPCRSSDLVWFPNAHPVVLPRGCFLGPVGVAPDWLMCIEHPRNPLVKRFFTIHTVIRRVSWLSAGRARMSTSYPPVTHRLDGPRLVSGARRGRDRACRGRAIRPRAGDHGDRPGPVPRMRSEGARVREPRRDRRARRPRSPAA